MNSLPLCGRARLEPDEVILPDPKKRKRIKKPSDLSTHPYVYLSIFVDHKNRWGTFSLSLTHSLYSGRASSSVVHVQAVGGGAGERVLRRVPSQMEQLAREVVSTRVRVSHSFSSCPKKERKPASTLVTNEEEIKAQSQQTAPDDTCQPAERPPRSRRVLDLPPGKRKRF